MKEILEAVLRSIEEAGVPKELQPIAFEKLLAHRLQQAQPGSARSTLEMKAAGNETTNIDAKGAGSGLGRIANELELPLEDVREVFAEDDERGLMVIVSQGKIDSTNAGGTKELALLVAGGRQVGGLEEWTSSTHIRGVVEEYGRFDSGNYANTLIKMGDVFGYRGKGMRREVRLNRVGIDQLKKLVVKLSGGPSDGA